VTFTKRLRLHFHGRRALPGDVVVFNGYALLYTKPAVRAHIGGAPGGTSALVIGINRHLDWVLVWIIGTHGAQVKWGWVRTEYTNVISSPRFAQVQDDDV